MSDSSAALPFVPLAGARLAPSPAALLPRRLLLASAPGEPAADAAAALAFTGAAAMAAIGVVVVVVVGGGGGGGGSGSTAPPKPASYGADRTAAGAADAWSGTNDGFDRADGLVAGAAVGFGMIGG